jgi:hypothetical protein
VVIRQQGIPDEELPVVLFIAAKAKVNHAEIVKLRAKKWAWMRIASRYRLDPSIFYVPVKTEVKGSIYGKPYGYYKSAPQSRWKSIKLSDTDVVNFVNLRFISEHYGYDPDEVIKMRETGRNFVIINDELKKKAKPVWKKKDKKDWKNKMTGMDAFFEAVAEYNGVENDAVIMARGRGVADDELAVVFFFANEANVPYEEIVKLRARSWAWHKIAGRYRIDPSVFYVNVKGEVKGRFYARPYGYIVNKPKNAWKHIRLDDEEVINLVNLRFISERYGREPLEVMKMREDGKNFMEIENELSGANKRKHRSWKEMHEDGPNDGGDMKFIQGGNNQIIIEKDTRGNSSQEFSDKDTKL